MSPYLRKTIKAILAAVALTAVNSPASAGLHCTDNACYFDDSPGPGTPGPNLPYPGGGYPDDPGDDNGGGSGSKPAPTTTPNYAVCANLLNIQPAGCTRDLAQTGLQTPTSLIPSSWQALGENEESPLMARQFRDLLNRALVDLSKCYADISEDPEMCESTFVTRLGNGDAIQTLGSLLDPQSFDDGRSQITRAVAAARLTRQATSWVNAAALLAVLNDFNDALYKARQQKSCAFWVAAWDQAHCP